MESFDRVFASALRDLDAGLQQAIYYAVFIDVVLLISLGIFIWCCCVYVLNYKRLVDESVRVKKSEKVFYMKKAERERLETIKLKYELGMADSFNEVKNLE